MVRFITVPNEDSFAKGFHLLHVNSVGGNDVILYLDRLLLFGCGECGDIVLEHIGSG